MINKINKLVEIHPMIEELKEENEKLRISLKSSSQEVSTMKVLHNTLAEDKKNNNDLLKETRQELELHKIRSIWLEVHSRRNNVKFFNVQETKKMVATWKQRRW